jgi:hypothetical protein
VALTGAGGNGSVSIAGGSRASRRETNVPDVAESEIE